MKGVKRHGERSGLWHGDRRKEGGFFREIQREDFLFLARVARLLLKKSRRNT
jgi:hypothetical protein